jgi:uncharacterized membrane protein
MVIAAGATAHGATFDRRDLVVDAGSIGAVVTVVRGREWRARCLA